MSTDTTERGPDGYRRSSAGGPLIRADIVEVFVVRRPDDALDHSGRPVAGHAGRIEFLQLFRARDPLRGTWHPIIGHCETGESGVDCAFRELHEEVGLETQGPAHAADPIGIWALEQVHPFYVAAIDAVVLSPRFVALVSPGWAPRLNAENAASRWISESDVDRLFLWPGQRSAAAEAARIVRGDPCAPHLLLWPPSPG